MTTGIPEGDLRASTNQPPPLVGHNVVTTDLALVEAVTRHASDDVLVDLVDLGRLAGTEEARRSRLSEFFKLVC
jgi:putative acyl-CoA dehydrogenase